MRCKLRELSLPDRDWTQGSCAAGEIVWTTAFRLETSLSKRLATLDTRPKCRDCPPYHVFGRAPGWRWPVAGSAAPETTKRSPETTFERGGLRRIAVRLALVSSPWLLSRISQKGISTLRSPVSTGNQTFDIDRVHWRRLMREERVASRGRRIGKTFVSALL